MFRERVSRLPELAALLTPQGWELLEKHYHLLCVWNQKMNLTSVRDEEEMIERHYVDSLFLARQLPEGSISVVDLGSGAGFPGVVIAACRREAQVTLVESKQKKAAFLVEATRGFGNVRVAAKRMEDLTGVWDWAVSRAVSWEDLEQFLVRCSRNVAISAGPDETREGAAFQWRPPILLPGSRQRYIIVGENQRFLRQNSPTS